MDEYRRNDQHERLLRLIVREPEDTRGTQYALSAPRIWISLPEHNAVRWLDYRMCSDIPLLHDPHNEQACRPGLDSYVPWLRYPYPGHCSMVDE